MYQKLQSTKKFLCMYKHTSEEMYINTDVKVS